MAKGFRVAALPLWMYCDDTSGNMSKKWNEHNSFLFTLAGLPREHTAKEYNIHFLCTSNIAPPLEMMDGVVSQIEYVFLGASMMPILPSIPGMLNGMVSGHGTVNIRNQFSSFLLFLHCLGIIPCIASLLVILDCGGSFFAARVGSKEAMLKMLAIFYEMSAGVRHETTVLLLQVLEAMPTRIPPMIQLLPQQAMHLQVAAWRADQQHLASVKNMRKVTL